MSGWLAPQDGGRGREIRRRWWSLRWFSLRYGSFIWRTKVRCHIVRWFVAEPNGEVVFGAVSTIADDGDRYTSFGFWPWRLDYTASEPWLRPSEQLQAWAALSEDEDEQ